MQTPRPELHHTPQQPTLSAEMFPEPMTTLPQPEIAPNSPTADAGPSGRCDPSGVWRTLMEPQRNRINSNWTKVMREVANDGDDGG